MENDRILQPNELAEKLAEMPKGEQQLVLAFAQGMMTRAALDEQSKGGLIREMFKLNIF